MSLSHFLTHDLTWHDRERWDKTLSMLEAFIAERRGSPGRTRELSEAIREGIGAIDPFIQLNTAEVCPACRQVCCINRHGYYDYEDLIYIYSLGHKAPAYKNGLHDTVPCQFIAKTGCTIERAIRPFRCNWYFCDALLKHMEDGPAKPYRSFVNRFHEVIEMRREMLDEFFRVVVGRPSIGPAQ
jgi:hypothetical protein